ncbi:unnamed protein product [Thlaspi arvense]|uniref:Uncharacterized protein n=1 Tax=Thlaspi arvense TaxID=13288 RepID=A0AAU9SHD2_THLAR|nr:unnamed protein product [Thlaspi arvense]
MGLPGEGDYMATGHERSKTRHNFTLPNLKWGVQRNLRCMKVESDGGSASGDHRLRRRPTPSKFDGAAPFRLGGGFENNRSRRLEKESWRPASNGDGEGIKEFTEKIMSDLRTMTESIFRKQSLGVDEEEEEETNEKEELEPRGKERSTAREVSPPEAPGETTVEARPWNLRKRRAACKSPIHETGTSEANQYSHKGSGVIEEKRVNPSSLGNKSANSSRPKFISTLTKKEVEDDYMAMMCQRPPRRPKKRPRTVQKQVDLLLPAHYFSEITKDIYKVPDGAENRKR